MNETILALMSALAIYGLSSLALSRPDGDPRDEWSDIQSEEVADSQPTAPREDDDAV